MKKTFKALSLTLVMLFLCQLSMAQNISPLKLNQVTVKKAIAELKKSSGYLFVYSSDDLDTKKVVNVNATTLRDAIGQILAGQNLSYSINGKNVVLSVKKNPTQQVRNGQSRKVSGQILDQQGEPLIGVNILEKGTTNGTVSDLDGNFTLELKNVNSSLLLSFVGFETMELSANGNLSKIILKEDSEMLEDVVVIGYGSVKKKDLTGAITQVKAENYSTSSATNVLDMLSGTIAGFNASFGTSASGASSMEIRGPASLSANNSPLIVLDGVIFNGGINDINPADIETVEVLKDASAAAVYGARSAAGVIMINTKKGKTGKVSINLSVKEGLTSFTNYVKPNNLEQYLQRRQDFLTRLNSSKPLGYYANPENLPEGVDLNTWLGYDVSHDPDATRTWMNRLTLKEIEQENYLNGVSYDWYDEVTRPGLRQDYALSVSSGSEKNKYFFSVGLTDNKGFVIGDEYKTIRTRINADTKLTSWMTVGVNAQFSNKDNSSTAISLRNVYEQSPLATPYDENGNLKWYTSDDSGVVQNPYIDNAMREKLNITQSLFATLYAEIKLPFGFNYKISYINRYNWSKNYYYDSTKMPAGDKLGGYGQRINTSLYEWQVDNILSWRKTFGVHDFYATFLVNAEKNQSWSDTVTNQGFSPSEALNFHQLSLGASPTITNNDTYGTGTALMARLNYTLLDRYLLTLSVRKDGYSAFGQKHPYATFPSAALAWTISEEKFWNVKWVDELKLRASYGLNGNRDIGIYSALAKLGTTKYLSDGNQVIGIFNDTMSNADLRWEKTASLNLGINFSILKNRLSGTLDYYDMKTTDLLLPRSLPAIIGYKSVMSNMGELKNHGFEATLNSVNMKKKDFDWTSTLTFSMNRNEVRHLYGEMVDVKDENGNVIGQKEADDHTNGWFIGHSIDQIWDYKFLGIYQLGEEEEAKKYGKAPGDIKLLDVDGNGAITEEDKVFQGYKTPRYRLGLRNDVHYKNFELSVFLRADLGHWRGNSLLSNTNEVEDRKNQLHSQYWTPSNPTNKYTRLLSVKTPSFTIYEQTGFLRLQDITLGYSIPKQVISKIGLERCRLYLNGRNLLTATKWSGYDPESGDTPMPKIITFGIDVTL